MQSASRLPENRKLQQPALPRSPPLPYPKVTWPQRLSFYDFFFFLMQQISSKIHFSPVSPGCTEKQLSVLKSQWGIRMADGHPLSSRVTPPTTSEDLICHKHHRGDCVSRGECLQLTQSKQLGRLPGRMTWKKSELPGGGRLSCR